MPSPVVPDQIPIARARSFAPVKTLMRIDNVDGMIAAAPMPMNARAAISRSGVTEKADAADPAPNTRSPTMKTHLRPRRSPRLPATSSNPAKTIAYASTIHWSSLDEACMARTIVGSATFKIVLSRLMTSRLTQSTARINHRCRNASLGPSGTASGSADTGGLDVWATARRA